MSEKFDRIVSIGMFEHVGKKNYRDYMATAFNNLVDDGLFLLHTIGTNAKSGIDPWVTKYIFPNSALPMAQEIPSACAGHFVIADWHNLGGDYIKTLKAWYKNFVRHWNSLKNKDDERFYRMWTYYLSVFMGGFQAKRLEVWQVVLAKSTQNEDYLPVR